MKVLVRINISDYTNKTYVLEQCMYAGYDYELNIYTDGNLSYDELLDNREKIEGAIKEYNDFLDFNKNMKEFEDVKKLDGYQHLIDSIDAVYVDVNNNFRDIDHYEFVEMDEDEKQEIIDGYIENHPELHDHKIIINEVIRDDTNVDELKEKYKEFKEVLVLASESMDPISLDTAKTKDVLDTLVNNIKELDLTPLEQVLLVYDIVRNKPYQHEKVGQSCGTSRDVLQALNGDSIVCLGYANIIDSLLRRLGINASIVLLDGIKKDEAGHARNAVLIKDVYYGVNGIFLLDATIDSRDKHDRYNYLYDYKAFLKKKHQLKKYDIDMQIEDTSLGFLNNHSIEETEELLKLNSLNPIQVLSLSEAKKKDFWGAKKFLKTCLELVCPEKLGYDDTPAYRNNLYKEYEQEIKELFKSELPISTFIQALISVRFIENKIDPKNYPFDIEKMILRLSTFGFKVDADYLSNYISQRQRLYQAVFSDEEDVEIKAPGNPADGLRNVISDMCDQISRREIKHEYKVVDSIKLYNKGNKKAK